MFRSDLSKSIYRSMLGTRLSLRVARFLVFSIFITLAAALLFTASSAATSNHSASTSPNFASDIMGFSTSAFDVDSWKKALRGDSSRSKSDLFAFMPLPQSGSEQVTTYDATCTTPKSAFILGDIVCAKVEGGPSFQRRLALIDSYPLVRDSQPITSDPQNILFTLPALPVSTINGQTYDNRGVWRVNIVPSSRFSVRATASFTVSNPVLPEANLAIFNSSSAGDSITAGSNIFYNVVVQNPGPDVAQNVQVTSSIPANTTFLSGAQDSPGAQNTFTCTFPNANDSTGSTTCTIASLPAGQTATFMLVYNVNSGAGAGTVISSTASVSSDTPDSDNADNSSTSNTSIVAGAPTNTCTLDCPTNITVAADTTENSQRGAHVTFPNPSTVGDCGNPPVLTATPSSGSFFPVGRTTVNFTSATGDGACSFDVTVIDTGTNPPTISCPPDKTANADSNCSATVVLGTPTTTGDNVTVVGSRSDGLPMYDCDANGENCVRKSQDLPFSAGQTTITWTATSHDTPGPWADESLHTTGTASCTQIVTVNDVTPPNIAATDQTVSADANCQATVPDYSSTVTDNCACDSSDSAEACAGHPHVTVTQSPAPGTIVGRGPHTIHITANDGSSNNNGAGNTSEKDITLTVNDTTAPSISCPSDISVTSPTGACSVTVNLGVPTATDNCDGNVTPVPSRSDSKPITDPFPVGTTTVTWTATDSSGNHSSCDQKVVVADNEPPVISCPGNVDTTTDTGACSASHVNHGTATATDNCSGATVSGTRSDGHGLDDPYPKGTTTITWTATDASGNHSSCDQTVTVKDKEAPVISCPANIVHGTDPGMCSANLNPGTATATDNCDNPTISSARSDGQALNAPYPKGTTTITWTATDSSGNLSSCAQTVTVNDTEAPTLTLNGNTPSMWPPNHSYHTFHVTDFVTGASDNCDTLSVSDVVIAKVTSDEAENANGSGNTLNDIVIAGDCKSVQLRAEREQSGNGRVYTITFRVRDSAGNETTRTAKVTVPVNSGGTAVDSGPHYTVTSSCP
ncbi:MAG: hypothetical protein DMF68_04595 [Acidobacteria bacterium]|nr:MAG: hypothetical protein DMF68_04595 [Acidobacteriota bacterium]